MIGRVCEKKRGGGLPQGAPAVIRALRASLSAMGPSKKNLEAKFIAAITVFCLQALSRL
jgi:hypothetical protein